MEREEALEIVRKLYNNSLFLKKDKEAIVTLIPELAENEDERIRKELICFLETEIPQCNARDKYIAWLEKQREKKSYASETMNEKGDFDSGFTRMMENEQKPWSEEDERIRKALIKYLDALDDDEIRYGVSFKDMRGWLEKQSKASKVEQAMREVEEKADAFTEAHKGETSDEILAQMRGEQKPWSEEDEKMLNDILMCGEHHCYLDAGNIAWLKSLKDRVQPKPAEWSEEDETGLTNTIIMLKEGASLHFNKKDITKAVDWLKSLKPQNTWKPSEEQMKALLNMRFAVERFGPSASLAALDDLYEQLKKL